MTVFSIKPMFSDLDDYRRWRYQWRSLFKSISIENRRMKYRSKNSQREGKPSLQKQVILNKVMGFKLMSLLKEGEERWKRICEMKKSIAEQMASFPLILEDCREITKFYNKASNEFSFLPMWVVKTKGKTYYVTNIESNCPWTTKEKPDSSTRGSIKFRKCNLHIDVTGHAIISMNTT